MVTAYTLYNDALNSLDVQTVLDKEEINNTKEVIRNIMTIKFDLEGTYFNEGKRYSVCLASNMSSFGATAFQTEDINILPPDVDSMVVGSQ